MNERIKKLADAALIPFKDENGFECHHFSKELFALWIIKECVAKLLTMDAEVNGNHNYYRHAAVQIEEHFGVES